MDELSEDRRRFCAELRRLMGLGNWTTVALAEAVGVTQGTVSYWLNGRNLPGPERVFELETAMDLAPGTLSAHLGYVPVPRTSAASCEEAVLACADLDDLGKDAVISVLRVHTAHAARRRARRT